MPSIKLTRREFLKVSAASAALASAGCVPPAEKIVPYADQPEAALPGVPKFYATAASFVGAAEGLLVESNTGRPTKVEGNRGHPASLGGTSIHGQASVLELWDPARSRTPRRNGLPATREQLRAELAAAAPAGSGLAVLVAASTSPTLARQLGELKKRYPQVRVHRWDPLIPVPQKVVPIARLDQAGAILSLDARFLDDHPWRLAYARQFAAARTPRDGRMARLYTMESAPSLDGAMADHRYARPVHEIERWLASPDKILADLRKNRGVILAGPSLSPWAHARVAELNSELGAPVSYVPAVQVEAAPLDELVRAMNSGEVKVLAIVGGNPVYDAPADLAFGEALSRVAVSAHLSLFDDETSARCTWHLPATHFMEHWSDERALDGTASIVQPLIAPLYGGTSPHELVGWLSGDSRRGYDIVRETWRDIDWTLALRKGVVAGTAFKPMPRSGRESAHRDAALRDLPPAAGWSVRFVADQCVLDGRFAPNAWLQELPRSHSKITWDNAALVSPASARVLGVQTGEMLEITVQERHLLAPAWVEPHQADGGVTLALGYGRTRAGPVGTGVGFDAYRLRGSESPWHAAADVRKVPGRHEFATTQNHARMEGRDLARHVSLAELVEKGKAFPEDTPRQSLYPEWPYEGYRWGMAIDLNTCIGCNACTIACQAENNIPVVGKEEVIAGREMHWIRVDRYYQDEKTLFQPVPCMHCENAPCEYVCPVEAAVHDAEGLNLQVYNRCVGTRFCSQNCPYKVRRFNFLQYSSHEETLKAQKNPEVTVRMRGVMEKCTYCLQRIQRARIEAEKDGRRIGDGEVITACQAACPTQAIVFGDLNDPQSAVNRAKASPLDYSLLAELNTRPRTSYGARVINEHE